MATKFIDLAGLTEFLSKLDARFATIAQGQKADAAIPNPETKADGNILKYNGTSGKWEASTVPASGVLSVTNGDTTITVDNTDAANPKVKANTDVMATKEFVNGEIADVAGDLAAEISRAQNAETALGNRLTAAEGDITGLTDDLTAEVSRAQAAETALGNRTTAIEGDVAGIKDDVTELNSDLTAEISRATAAEEALDNKIDALENGKFEVVTVLPTPSEELWKQNKIYLFKPTGATTYEEWIIAKTSDGTYILEKLGDADIKLGDYWAKADLVAATIEEIDALFA